MLDRRILGYGRWKGTRQFQLVALADMRRRYARSNTGGELGSEEVHGSSHTMHISSKVCSYLLFIGVGQRAREKVNEVEDS